MHGVFEFYISFILIIFLHEVLNMVVLVEDKVYYFLDILFGQNSNI